MAKQNSTLSFKDAYIYVEHDLIEEVTKDGTVPHKLSDVLSSLEGKCLNISFKENQDVLFPKGDE